MRLSEIHRLILSELEENGTHETYVRRELDQHFEVPIRYATLHAQLDDLAERGLIRETGPLGRRYKPTETALHLREDGRPLKQRRDRDHDDVEANADD